jgi:hypothetical protein
MNWRSPNRRDHHSRHAGTVAGFPLLIAPALAGVGGRPIRLALSSACDTSGGRRT